MQYFWTSVLQMVRANTMLVLQATSTAVIVIFILIRERPRLPSCIIYTTITQNIKGTHFRSGYSVAEPQRQEKRRWKEGQHSAFSMCWLIGSGIASRELTSGRGIQVFIFIMSSASQDICNHLIVPFTQHNLGVFPAMVNFQNCTHLLGGQYYCC